MFKSNESHYQSLLFGPGNLYPDTLRKRLESHWSTRFYQKVFREIDETLFEPLFSDTGRPNFPANILAGLEILKEMHGLSDEQLYDRYLFDYTYQRALGVEDIGRSSFAIRTLYHFRAAVAEYEASNGVSLYQKIFEDGRDRIIKEIGIRTGALRTDSVMIEANIKRMNRISLFHKVFSNLVRDLAKNKVQLSERYTSLLKEDEDGFSYRLLPEEVGPALEELAQRIRELLLDHGNALVDEQSRKDAERLLAEQCTVESGMVSLKPGHTISSDALQNPADPDATYRKKRDEEHRGYSAHAAETCDPENRMQVITHVDLVKNNEDDAKVLLSNLDRIKADTGAEIIVADGGFVSSEIREKCDGLNIGFVATAIRGRAQDEDRLTSVDFEMESGLVSRCPAGHSPVKRSLEKDGNSKATFSRSHCGSCEFESHCIAYRPNGNGRISIDENRRWLDRRAKALTEGTYQKLCRLRPPVEGLMEKLKPKYLRGRTLFRGQVKAKSRLMLRATALNFRRYLAWMLRDLFYFLWEMVSVWKIPAGLHLPV